MDGTLFDTARPLTEAEIRAWRQETTSMMRAWEKEKDALEATIANASAQLVKVKRRLEHAKGLMEDDAQSPGPQTQSLQESNHSAAAADDENDEASHASVIAAAITAALVAGSPRGLRCGSLRAEVNRHPIAGGRVKDHPNRFYSVLNRMVGKDKIVRKGKLYRLPMNDSPQGETGAVAAPASH